ncbi:MAG: aldo/keto reductase [Ignavibacteriaceae bacterium]|nr:aldo/keto reductase [Ignavibacteriaceae bacterium]
MKYSQLGNSGLIVSRFATGTMLFGGEGDFYGLKYSLDQSAADELVTRSIDFGINIFDTANMYNAGQSEIMLGKALKGRRSSVLISDKISFRAGSEAFNAGISYKHIIEQCEISLRRLGTDCIDILSLHTDDPVTPIEETAKALEHLQQQGKIRYAGMSNWPVWKTAAIIQLQKDRGYSPLVSAQMHYSLLNRELDAEFVSMAKHFGLGMMVWSPLSSGFLTGKYTRSNPKPEEGRLNSFDLNLFDREKAYDVVDVVRDIAARHNTSPTAVSLAWLLSKSYCSAIIIGVSKISQLQDNFNALSVELDSEDLERLEKITALRIPYPASFSAFNDPVLSAAKV